MTPIEFAALIDEHADIAKRIGRLDRQMQEYPGDFTDSIVLHNQLIMKRSEILGAFLEKKREEGELPPHQFKRATV